MSTVDVTFVLCFFLKLCATDYRYIMNHDCLIHSFVRMFVGYHDVLARLIIPETFLSRARSFDFRFLPKITVGTSSYGIWYLYPVGTVSANTMWLYKRI